MLSERSRDNSKECYKSELAHGADSLLESDRPVGELVAVVAPAREVAGEHVRCGLDPRHHSFAALSPLERVFHRAANRFPFRRGYFGAHATIGDDLDVAVGEEQVD